MGQTPMPLPVIIYQFKSTHFIRKWVGGSVVNAGGTFIIWEANAVPTSIISWLLRYTKKGWWKANWSDGFACQFEHFLRWNNNAR